MKKYTLKSDDYEIYFNDISNHHALQTAKKLLDKQFDFKQDLTKHGDSKHAYLFKYEGEGEIARFTLTMHCRTSIFYRVEEGQILYAVSVDYVNYEEGE